MSIRNYILINWTFSKKNDLSIMIIKSITPPTEIYGNKLVLTSELLQTKSSISMNILNDVYFALMLIKTKVIDVSNWIFHTIYISCQRIYIPNFIIISLKLTEIYNFNRFWRFFWSHITKNSFFGNFLLLLNRSLHLPAE